MFDSTRFRERLDERHLTQRELAKRVGVAQQTISRLANGERYGSKHLHRIARELGTTPAYLTGETDDPDADAPEAPELTSEHRQLLDCFDQLDREDRAALIRIAHTMAGRKPEPRTVHSPAQDFRHAGHE